MVTEVNQIDIIGLPKKVYVVSKNKFEERLLHSNKTLAVIGSRNMSPYGKSVIWDFVPKLIEKGICVVSGLAEGVDEEAQKAALKSGGQTIGVLGFGHTRLSVFSNRELCKEIVNSERGFLVSPFEPCTLATKQTFLERNKVIAAISSALLVVEATFKSGCMSTVEAALDFGKEVYVIPGSVFSYTSMGTNELIKQGAHLVTSVNDIDF